MIALAIFVVVVLIVIGYFVFKNKPSDSKIIPTPTPPSKYSYLETENPWVRMSDGTCKKYNEALSTGYSPINFPCLSPTCSGTKNDCETLPVKPPPAPIPGPVKPPPAPIPGPVKPPPASDFNCENRITDGCTSKYQQCYDDKIGSYKIKTKKQCQTICDKDGCPDLCNKTCSKYPDDGPVNPPPANDCTTIPTSCSNVNTQAYCQEHGKECVQCYTDILKCKPDLNPMNCYGKCPFQDYSNLPKTNDVGEDFATNACINACHTIDGDGGGGGDNGGGSLPNDPPECPGLNKAWNDYGGRDGNACDNPNFMAVGKQCYDNLLIKDKVDRDGSGNCMSACDNLESVLQIPVCNNICTSACKKETFVNRRR